VDDGAEGEVVRGACCRYVNRLLFMLNARLGSRTWVLGSIF